MKIYQREILFVDCYIPNDGLTKHPVLVISNDDINEYENHFVGVMLSSSENFNDNYSFWLEDKMLTKKMKKRLPT